MPTGATHRRQRPAARAGVDVPGLSWPEPPRGLELSFVWIDGEELAVLSHPLEEPPPLERLTEAERQVTVGVLDGLSNEQIAHRRGTTSSTVARQIASVFRKLGVGSRRQLASTMRGSGRSGRAVRH
jgi:DNA-binding CsgD family transcriptional regulator